MFSVNLHVLSVCVCVGDFSYEKGSSGWTDSSIGSQQWVLNDTPKGNFWTAECVRACVCVRACLLVCVMHIKIL